MQNKFLYFSKILMEWQTLSEKNYNLDQLRDAKVFTIKCIHKVQNEKFVSIS